MTNERTHARLRLATSDGVLASRGYRSGRKRWRETPLTASTASTRSAGRRDANQSDTLPCDLSPSLRANADCPPTALHASKSASLLMTLINAQTANLVNAQTGNRRRDNSSMSRTASFQPSPFWRRLAEALGDRWAPLNPNSVATKLKMSQGSVYRWYRGEGFPELETALQLAKEGGVCVDWLLNNVKPKYPISRDPVLKELLEICEELHEDGRLRVLRAARGELLQQQGETHVESEPARKRV